MTTTPEREQLLELEAIAREAQNQPYPIPTSMWGKQTAMAVYAAGYRRPRTITTVEELDALGIGSVVIDADEYVGRKERDTSPNCWAVTLHKFSKESRALNLPATLLHDGGKA